MANLGYLQLTRECPNSCRFCSNPPTGVDLDLASMERAIERLIEMGYDGLILTGGEPSTSSLLIPALSCARNRGLAARMITNGHGLADRELFERCVSSGLGHIHLSLYSWSAKVHDYITRRTGSFDLAVRTLGLAAKLGVTCDINTVINTYNSDHLHETVHWICNRFPAVNHFVWNNMDPDGNRAEEHPDSIPVLREFEVSLDRAMRFLERKGKTFRAERVPLCYMRRFAWASTETRKIVKQEERCVQFLDRKGFIHQTDFRYGKGRVCAVCGFDSICAGLYSMGRHYDERELSPVFSDPETVVRRILGPGLVGVDTFRQTTALTPTNQGDGDHTCG